DSRDSFIAMRLTAPLFSAPSLLPPEVSNDLAATSMTFHSPISTTRSKPHGWSSRYDLRQHPPSAGRSWNERQSARHRWPAGWLALAGRGGRGVLRSL